MRRLIVGWLRWQEFYRSAFAGSGLVVSGGVGVGSGEVLGQARPEVTGDPVSLLLLPEFVPTESGAETGGFREADTGEVWRA